MQISKVRIQNFRSIHDLIIDFAESNVFIGTNGAGKSAIVDAIRIGLTRRWGQRGTGFTELDVHRPDEGGDPKTLPPVTIEIHFREPSAGAWDADMVADLDEIMTLDGGKNLISLRVTAPWNGDKESYDTIWQFLTPTGEPLTGKAQRATNLTGFFKYVPVFWLGALRDAADEFTPSGHWGRLLKNVKIPKELEAEVLKTLAEIDAKVIGADKRLSDIAALIGEATKVAIGEGLGGARLNMLPLAIEEMLKRSGVLMRHEDLRPWLPLDHQGQGLQSLAVIFLFQAAVLQQLAEVEEPGTEAVFVIEEPEVHLHPQAARALWERMAALAGQRIMTTHSPYFVQHVPLRDLKLVRLRGGRSHVSCIPQHIHSLLPWNDNVQKFVDGAKVQKIFSRDPDTGCVTTSEWFGEKLEDNLVSCFKDDADFEAKKGLIAELRHRSRYLPSAEEERELGFHGRRVRGEIFFARRWIIVEGVCEYLLLQAIGRAAGWPLDNHGVTVIDFQQSGSAAVYPALADAFNIPWDMILDADKAHINCRKQILDRGYREQDLKDRVVLHPKDYDLEACLVADGHEKLLREIMAEKGDKSNLNCPLEEFISRLRNRKTDYASSLAIKVAGDPELAKTMPKALVELIERLKKEG